MRKVVNQAENGILRLAFEVHNTLGGGFLENLYEAAIVYELENANYKVPVQKAMEVMYKEIIAGEFRADIVVNDSIIIELKTAETITNQHMVQTINYLKATGNRVGLIISFGLKSVVYVRVVN